MTTNILILIVTLLVIGVAIMLQKRNHNLKAEVNNLNIEIKEAKEKNTKLYSEKKSSEVRLGLMGEQFAPLLKEFPGNSSNFRFLGSPIDGVSFEDNIITFIEFKTGAAKLSKKQKEIKRLIEEGKVTFKTITINENGITLN